MEKDLAAAKDLYIKIRDNKELIISLIDDILDLATFIPVCVAEYGNNEFESFNPRELIIKEIILLLEDYGYKISSASG